eukprot:2390763-Amphidinium_carterae.1
MCTTLGSITATDPCRSSSHIPLSVSELVMCVAAFSRFGTDLCWNAKTGGGWTAWWALQILGP